MVKLVERKEGPVQKLNSVDPGVYSVLDKAQQGFLKTIGDSAELAYSRMAASDYNENMNLARGSIDELTRMIERTGYLRTDQLPSGVKVPDGSARQVEAEDGTTEEYVAMQDVAESYYRVMSDEIREQAMRNSRTPMGSKRLDEDITAKLVEPRFNQINESLYKQRMARDLAILQETVDGAVAQNDEAGAKEAMVRARVTNTIDDAAYVTGINEIESAIDSQIFTNGMMAAETVDDVDELMTDLGQDHWRFDDEIKLSLYKGINVRRNAIMAAEEKAFNDRSDKIGIELVKGVYLNGLNPGDISQYRTKLEYPTYKAIMALAETESTSVKTSPRAELHLINMIEAVRNGYRMTDPNTGEELGLYGTAKRVRESILNYATQPDGELTLTPDDTMKYMAMVEELQDNQYSRPGYRNVRSQMFMLITRSAESAFEWNPAAQTSDEYARVSRALEDLHGLMREDPNVDINDWWQKNRSNYVNAEARERFNVIDKDVRQNIVFTDGEIAISDSISQIRLKQREAQKWLAEKQLEWAKVIWDKRRAGTIIDPELEPADLVEAKSNMRKLNEAYRRLEELNEARSP